MFKQVKLSSEAIILGIYSLPSTDSNIDIIDIDHPDYLDFEIGVGLNYMSYYNRVYLNNQLKSKAKYLLSIGYKTKQLIDVKRTRDVSAIGIPIYNSTNQISDIFFIDSWVYKYIARYATKGFYLNKSGEVYTVQNDKSLVDILLNNYEIDYQQKYSVSFKDHNKLNITIDNLNVYENKN